MLEYNKTKIIKRNDDILNEYLQNTKETMISYYKKSVEQIYKTQDGFFILIDKPSIKTNFCYGYGYCGISTLEEMEDANEMVDYSRTSEDHFIKENLESIEQEIKRILESIELNPESFKRLVFVPNLRAQYSLMTRSSVEQWSGVKYRIPTKAELLELLSLYVSTREHLKQRLNTYLKKYGLSKVRAWSYLSD